MSQADIDEIHARHKNTLIETLGMRFEVVEPDRVVVSLLVGPAVHQPYGLLHGGVSLVLAETAASVGAWRNIDQDRQWTVGLEINANHLRSVREGIVRAEAIPLHKGRTTMVWEVKLRDEQERLICVSRCTMAIIQKPE